LITKADGTKFGKTESGAVWLDPERTSPYQFYQYWLKLSDADAEKSAMSISFNPVEEIKNLIEEHRQAPHLRKLQKAGAKEMTEMVHGAEELLFAQKASEILFGQSAVETLRSLNEKQLLEVMDGVPQVSGVKSALENEGLELLSFLAEHKVFSSKGEARKMIQNGGLSINKEKISSPDFSIKPEHLLNGHYLLIQKGKSNYTLAIFS